MKVNGQAGPRPMQGLSEGSAYKAAVRDELLRYRSQRGIGSYNALASVSGGKLTATVIRGMMAGDNYPLSFWEAAHDALSAVQKTEEGR